MLDCRHLSFVDYSAIEALRTLRARYADIGKHLRVVHLSERCRQLLRRVGDVHGDRGSKRFT
ncbi:MAG: sodium-independent anion transporter [Burkholderiaceae bacterium]